MSEGEALLEELRPGAFAVAYRMLGSVAEAEEVVQEALLRLHATRERGERIASPRAYLATVTTRLAIDALRSARARRESYVGDWLPEPLPGYGEVAEIVGKSEDNARQLAVRARRHVAAGRPRFEASEERRRELGERFFAAVESGDVEALEGLLARDVVLRGDGGGKVPALARALRGADRVRRALGNWTRAGLRGGAQTERRQLNGQPGLVIHAPDGGVVGALSVEIADDRIVAINSVVNPDKLGHLGPVGDVRAMLRSD